MKLKDNTAQIEETPMADEGPKISCPDFIRTEIRQLSRFQRLWYSEHQDAGAFPAVEWQARYVQFCLEHPELE